MVNEWVEFVKDYATKNKISYGCAISRASKPYKTMKALRGMRKVMGKAGEAKKKKIRLVLED